LSYIFLRLSIYYYIFYYKFKKNLSKIRSSFLNIFPRRFAMNKPRCTYYKTGRNNWGGTSKSLECIQHLYIGIWYNYRIYLCDSIHSYYFTRLIMIILYYSRLCCHIQCLYTLLRNHGRIGIYKYTRFHSLHDLATCKSTNTAVSLYFNAIIRIRENNIYNIQV